MQRQAFFKTFTLTLFCELRVKYLFKNCSEKQNFFDSWTLSNHSKWCMTINYVCVFDIPAKSSWFWLQTTQSHNIHRTSLAYVTTTQRVLFLYWWIWCWRQFYLLSIKPGSSIPSTGSRQWHWSDWMVSNFITLTTKQNTKQYKRNINNKWHRLLPLLV